MNDHSFGIEKAANLQLLSMLKKKQANGYYYSEYTLNFGKRSLNINTSTQMVDGHKISAENIER